MESEPPLRPEVRYHLERRASEMSFRFQATEVLRRLPPDASPVLDLGCGTAPLAPLLLARGHDYVGADRDPAMLAGARRRLFATPGTLEVADAAALPFPEASFAAVTSLGLLEYLEDPVRAFAEIRRVLRPGSPAVLTYPRRDAPYRKAQAAVAPALRALGRSDPFDLRSGRVIRLDAIDEWAQAAGLELKAAASVAPAVLPWPGDRLFPGASERLARRAGPRWGTMELVVLASAPAASVGSERGDSAA